MKIKIVLIAIAAILISIFTTGCSFKHESSFDEWISPDGVHYWYETNVGGYSFLAPKYNHDGELVID